MSEYALTRARVEEYFDRTATKAWERLTTDAKVSRIRQTVRKGRDQMRELMISRLPQDLRGARILDAGCGTGAMSTELAMRGATVTAVDISPRLVQIAQDRLAPALQPQVRFLAGDMTDEALGSFDYVLAMDSLIYYTAPDIGRVLSRLSERTQNTIVFTVAPRTPFLMTFWMMGKLFPRSDRSPVMIPHSLPLLKTHLGAGLDRVGRINSGFYISDCLELRT
ncbi:MAG TPA: magnesium protoporphyrin IX methyltransferase [Rhodobacteraceae bacterium]|jgi:magnesium-protoporphyrin O-methyltransferase|nr:magnesium protoporphyrin IX methyltransferase [Paracoccaceae bacterium]HBV53492.1 magnesium protoporphyrin IX methyltransferase [Paracoccaceae bacterium]